MSRKVEKTDAQWRDQLTKEQYQVARDAGTEPAFTGAYLDNKQPGRYLCVCCSAHLFDSADKYDSGTGWPSFVQPADTAAVEEIADRSLGMLRTEVVCDSCGAHLGHVFADGPQPTGQRYCMNSLSLDFEPEG